MMVSKAHPDTFDIYNKSILGRFMVPEIAQQGGQPRRLALQRRHLFRV
jgi:hypothetical protein